MPADSAGPLWTPSPDRVARVNLTAFIGYARREWGADAHDFRSLYRWSVAAPGQFWPAVWRFCGVIAEERQGKTWDAVGIGLGRMAPPDAHLGPAWFPGARLNFAENLLRHRDERPALVSWSESGRRGQGRGELSYAGLYAATARAAAALRADGVRAGDRVAGFLPNIPETVIAMLATTSIGAIWSSCSPDFGVGGVVDRFGQIAPRVLICADGYRYGGTEHDSLERISGIVAAIPSIERVVLVPNLRPQPELQGAVLWEQWLETHAHATEVVFERFPFDHPVYILYSSGTTGLPKCMVHGAGGTLLQHQKEHVLHVDLTRQDRLFYFTTCGWMMWNWLASGLAVGATLVLYDGAPFAPAPDALWTMAEREQVTVFGTGPRYLALAEKQGLAPRRTHDLSRLRTMLSTGSPLSAHAYRYVYDRIKPDLHLCNISGGTELISCFAIGNPTEPVWPGELQGCGLGMAVAVWGPEGGPVSGGAGELVCTRPFPSMPVAFWNDPDGAKYRAAYFERFPGVWRHGDWTEFTPHGGLIIHGRSDATLNPGGVRIGTAEIYRQLDAVPEVVESLAIGQRLPGEEGGDERIVLFVRLGEGLTLDEGLRERIRRGIREGASPRHVPQRIVQVADLPRTISGKISELAVRAVVHGQTVRNRDALANPEALELFRDLPDLRA